MAIIACRLGIVALMFLFDHLFIIKGVDLWESGLYGFK